MRINISMSDSLIQDLDKHAEELNLSRSSYISMAVSQKIQGDDLAKSMPELMRTIKSLQDDLQKKDSQIKLNDI